MSKLARIAARPPRPARLARLATLVVATSLCGGCTVERKEVGPVVPVIDASQVSLALDPNGPWQEVAAPTPEEAAAAARGEAPGASVTAGPPPRPPDVVAMPAPVPATPTLEVPKARGLSEAAPKGQASARPLEEQARERFLDHPTLITAEQITLHVPAALAAQARLTGAEVGEPTPGRRLASGGARLVLRELTLEAPRITLRTRESGEDVQIAARGNVAFVSRQRDHVLREEGVRSLMITNDKLTPLR